MIGVNYLKSLIVIGAMAGLSSAFAAGDMLKPSEVNTQGESANPYNESGGFVGGGLSFGQALSTEGGSAGVAFFGHFEPGYQFNTGSWSRLELSLDLYSGYANFRNPDAAGGKVAASVGFGLMPKLGLGYSLGNKLTGAVKLGAGPVMAKLKLKPVSGSLESDGTVAGMAGLLGWEMIMPAGESLDFTGGVSVTHMQFDLDEVEGSGGTQKLNRPVNFNIPEARLGVRLRF